MHNEPLAFYGEMENVDWSVFAEGNLTQPCGLAIKDNRLFISDHGSNEIICYDTEDGEELGRIQVEAEGMMGIAIGPLGNLWYVDYTGSKVYQVIPK